jgi:hypothetical protein
MKKLLSGILLFAFSVGTMAGQTASERELSKALSEAVAAITTGLPIAVDEGTRLDSVSTVRNFMVYNNTLVKYAADEIDADSLDEILGSTFLKLLCNNQDLQKFVDEGVIMVYRYFGNDGVFVTEISKDMSTCSKTEVKQEVSKTSG